MNSTFLSVLPEKIHQKARRPLALWLWVWRWLLLALVCFAAGGGGPAFGQEPPNPFLHLAAWGPQLQVMDFAAYQQRLEREFRFTQAVLLGFYDFGRPPLMDLDQKLLLQLQELKERKVKVEIMGSFQHLTPHGQARLTRVLVVDHALVFLGYHHLVDLGLDRLYGLWAVVESREFAAQVEAWFRAQPL